MLIDITFAILIVIACIKGFQRGLVVAIFSIIAFIVGLAAALKLSAVVAEHLKNSLHTSAKWIPFISFALAFIVVVLLVRLGAMLIQKTFQFAMLGWANRLGGILLYAALYTIIFSVFLFYAEKIGLFDTAAFQASVTYPFIKPWGQKTIDGFGEIIPVFKGMFAQLEDFFGAAAEKIK